jgi:hypothetical protein
MVIAHGATAPTNIRALLEDMPPIPAIQARRQSDVELVSLTDADACIRSAGRVAGSLVIWDDGSIPDLSALANLKTVAGNLVVYGADGRSGLRSLAGLEKLEVGGLL